MLKKRHIAKTISYRVVSSTIGAAIAFICTGSFKFASILYVSELIYKPLQYYFHERVWYKYIKYGLKKNEQN